MINPGVLILFLVLISNVSIHSQENDWILRKDKKGVTVYTRENEATGNIEFKASIIIDTTVDSLLVVFKNVEGYTEWMADTKVSKTLSMVTEDESYIYFEAKVPWPLENRDIPLYQEIIKTEDGTKISLTGKPDYIPHKKGITRIREAFGTWTFIPLLDNQTKVTYKFLADPGLNIPKWIINLFIVDGPYKTLNNLKAIVGE